MNIGILLGRKGSVGLPGKNLLEVGGKPISEYVMMKMGAELDKCYLSTDDPSLAQLGRKYDMDIIDRPPELCTSTALSHDVFVHACGIIAPKEGDYVGKFFCNAPTFKREHIREAVVAVQNGYDCACTVSQYNMFVPTRAWQIVGEDLVPWPGVELVGSCDRCSAGDVWFYDCGVSMMNHWCITHMDEHHPPHKWLGGRVCPIKNDAGIDIDKAWQIGQLEWWHKTYGLEG